MSKHRILLCLAAALCVSGRSALLLVGELSLIYLLTILLRLLFNTLKWPYTFLTMTVFSVAVGSGLTLLLWAFVPNSRNDLGAALPLFVTWFVCGAAANERSPSFGRWVGGAGLLVIIGCVRELLSTASLFTYPLPFAAAGDVFGRNAAGEIGIGGLLVAAGLLWIFGQGRSLNKRYPFHAGAAIRLGMIAVMVAAADGVLRWVLPDVSEFWRFWMGLLLTIVPLMWDEQSIPWITTVIPATAAVLVSGNTVWVWIVTGIGVGLIVRILAAAWDRLYRSPLPARFAGAPCALTATAILLSAVRVLV